MTESPPVAPGSVPFALPRAAFEAADPQAALDWFRVRRANYISDATWKNLTPEARLLVRARIAVAASPRERVLSHFTAAAVWELPIVGRRPTQVEMVVEDRKTGRAGDVIRHRTQNPPAGVSHAGLTVTSPARTAVDIARTSSLACAVAVADDVLRRGLATHEQLVREREAVPRGGRGRQRARLAIALADGLSESPGESLSRVRMFELGYPRPALQREFFGRSGKFVARTDFFWRKSRHVGEFDGRLKYRLDDATAPSDAERTLWREKRREDALRRLGVGVVRWVWDEALQPDRLHRLLLDSGLRPEQDPTWLERY